MFLLMWLGVAFAGGATVVGGASPAWADPTPVPSPIGPPPTTAPTAAPKTPTPTPGPTPPVVIAPTSDDDDPGLFDIPGQIRKAINDFLLWIAKTGLKPVMDTLGHTVLSTPDLTGNAQVKAFWTTSLMAANGIFVLFVMAGGFIVASRDTLQSNYGLKEIAPRVVVGGVAANLSLLVAGKAIEMVNALTAAVAGQGVDGNAAVTAIVQMLDQPPGNTVPSILFSLLVLAVLVMAIVVVMTFLVRIALLVMLIGVAPLALMCHATPQTEGLAYTWWRAFGACLGIQFGQAVIILATVRIFLTPAGVQVLGMPATTGGLLAILVCLTMLWLLIKLPGFMKHLILGPLGQKRGRGLIGQIIHAVVMLKTLGALAGVGGAAARTRATRRPRSGPGTGTGPARGPSPTSPTPRASGPRPRPRPGSGAGAVPSRAVRPGRSRPSPAPVGSAAFSGAPTSHTSMPASAVPAGPPTFSAAPAPATPRRVPAVPAAPARFTPAPATPATAPSAGARPPSAQFSHAPNTATPARGPRPAPAATFSGTPRAPATPRRPPTPATRPFSSPSRSTEATGGTTPT
ncbi:hypothetical protein [Luedemannella flava]|uniref:hypothetical protein n=1 Tax=Luedemannella flava TaxID=349316 RepID=UPI0031D88AED